MGLFNFINKFKKQKENWAFANMLNGYTPIFSQFGQNIYTSDVVQQAISCIVMEMKKLNPQHVRKNIADIVPINSDIQKLLNDPNSLMTTSDFIEKIFWQLFFNYNSFIIPTYTTSVSNDGYIIKKYDGLWPVQPSQVDFIQDASEKLFIKLRFANNYETTLPYDDVIHIKYRFSVNEYMGGNISGQPDNDALLKTLQLNETLLQGVAKALKSSFAINGVIKYNTILDDGSMEQNIADLQKRLENNESGFLPLDMKGEFIPFQNKIQLVDEATLKFIDEKILRHFGVPLPILTGDYTKEQYEAFYQKTLEPLILSISQAFTKVLFTDREKSFGNEIMFYAKALIFMNTTQKLEMIRLLGDSGALFENEKRIMFGLQPLPELVGQRMQSLNYVNSNVADKYQLETDNDSNNNLSEESEAVQNDNGAVSDDSHNNVNNENKGRPGKKQRE